MQKEMKDSSFFDEKTLKKYDSICFFTTLIVKRTWKFIMLE